MSIRLKGLNTAIPTIVLALAVSSIFFACGSSLAPPLEGGLSVRIASGSRSTLLPDTPIVADRYRIVCKRTGKSDVVTTIKLPETTTGPIYLEAGSWNVFVQALNVDAIVVGDGQAESVVIAAGTLKELSITVLPLAGNGTLSLEIAIASGVFDSFSGEPAIKGTLEPYNDDTREPIAFTATLSGDRTKASWSSGESIPAGFYTLKLELFDGTVFRVRSAPESVRIAAGRVTSGEVAFGYRPGGIVVTVTTDLQAPLGIVFNGQAASLANNASMTVSATTTETVDSYTWYLDGEEIPNSNRAEITIGAGLSARTHRLDLVVGKGVKTGSEYLTFVVLGDTQAPAAPDSVQARAFDSLSIEVGWGPSSDNYAVEGFNVYRDGTLIQTTGSHSFIDSVELVAGVSYIYTVKAFDAIGNLSEAAAAAAVGVSDDTFSAYDRVVYNASGLAESTNFFSVGADLAWQTGDDIQTGITVIDYDGTGKVTLSSYYNSAGSDGDWNTVADNALFAYWPHAYDAFGRLSTVTYTSSGTAWYRYVYHYAGTGDLYEWMDYDIFAGGPVGVGYTFGSFYDSSDKKIKEIKYATAGSDGDWHTASDNEVASYTAYIYDAAGVQIKDISYSGAGSDGIWFNADDLVSSYNTYKYDQSGKKVHRLGYDDAGENGIWQQ